MRYNNLPIYNDSKKKRNYYGTFNISLNTNDFDSKIIKYNYERLDYLADKFYNDGTKWWIIALFNKINNPLVIDRTYLLIPSNPREIEEYVGIEVR